MARTRSHLRNLAAATPAAAALALMTACVGSTVRAVPEVLPPVGGHELTPLVQVDALVFSREEGGRALEGSFPLPEADALGSLAPALSTPDLGSPPPAAAEGGASSPLALPLVLDLGRGEFPYDDEIHPIHGSAMGRGGLSSSVIQLSWREAIDRGVGVHGTAALFRTQDEALLEVLSDARLGWFAVGLHASF
jgi:hypothetical protein